MSSTTNTRSTSLKDDFTVTSPGGLTISFGSSRGRRRSSIAVIPQMQICPGDLLVYSKQLIDRMNQSDDQANEPPQFLTIDGKSRAALSLSQVANDPKPVDLDPPASDKKGKNIWSSLKLVSSLRSLSHLPA